MNEPAERATRAGIAVAAVVCASVVVSHIFGRFSYSLLLPAIRDDLVDSYTGAGFLGFSYFGGYMLGVVGVTVVSARLDPVVLLRTGLALSVLALGVLATAPRFSVFASGVFFAGMAGAGIWIPAPTIATSGIPARRRGLVIGSLTATMGVGLLGVSQGATLYRSLVDDDGAWRAIFGIEAGLTVLILVAAASIVRVGSAGGDPERVEPARPAADRTAIFDLDGLRSVPQWARLTVAYSSYAMLAGAWTQFFGVAMEEDAGFGSAHVNNLFSVLAVASVVGALAFGSLSDRIGRDRAMAWACLSCAAGSFLVPIGREPFAALAAAVFGIGSFGVPPLAAAAVRDHLEGRAFATAFGAMTIVYATSSMVASQAAGVLADLTGGFTLVYLALGTIAAAAALTAETRHRR